MFCRTKEVYLVMAVSLIMAFISVLISLGGIQSGWFTVNLQQASYPYTQFSKHTWHIGTLKYSDSFGNETVSAPLPEDITGLGIAMLILTAISGVFIPICFFLLFRKFNPLIPGSLPPQVGSCSPCLAQVLLLLFGGILLTVVALFPTALSEYFDSNSFKYQHVHISMGWAWVFSLIASIGVAIPACLLNGTARNKACQEPVRGDPTGFDYLSLNDDS